MFKNRALSIKVVKDNPPKEDAPHSATLLAMTPEQISQIAKDHASNAAVLLAALYTGKVVLDTARDVVLITARAKIR